MFACLMAFPINPHTIQYNTKTGTALVPNMTSTDLHDLVLEKCRRIMTGYIGAAQVPFYFSVDQRVSA
jgi:hypothetical protein